MRKETATLAAHKCNRFVIVSILASLSTAGVSAQPRNSLNSLLSVVAQPSEFPGGASEGDFELFLTNLSGKGITAYNIELTTYSARGPETYAVSSDLLPSYASVSRAAPDNDSRYFHLGPLRAGEHLSQLLAKKYARDSRIIANVTTIVFDDNTVAGDRVWAAGVFEKHAVAAAELDALLGTLRIPSNGNLREQLKRWRQELPQRWQSKARSEATSSSSGLGFARTFVMSKLEEVSRDSLSDAEVAKHFLYTTSLLSDTANDMQQHSRMVEETR